ncbi:MAG: lytic transglycosylase domain-containing protein [Acidimicrobiia bacterium]|jgi:hypothetical protein
MTVSSLFAAGSRIGEIQSHFRHNLATSHSSGSTRASFAETLAAAQVETSSPDTFAVAPLANPATTTTAVPIGILGTPIITRSGSVLTGATNYWRGLLPAAGQQWADQIECAATDAGIDPRLLAALVWQESGFDAAAVSPSGATGLAQLMPATAQGLGVDPEDAAQNLDGGARYLAWTIKEFGSIDLGLAAYNAGPGRVRQAGGIPNIAETRAYVPRVLDYYRQLGGVA